MNQFLFTDFRKAIQTILFSVLASQLSAQYYFNRSVHEKTESATRVLEVIGDDYYFMTSKLNNASNRTITLYRYDKQGNQLFKKDGFIRPFSSFKSIDNKLIVLGEEIYCDVIPQFRPFYMTKVDTNGSVLFTDTISGRFGVLQYVDSSFIGFRNGSLYRNSKNGQFISAHSTGLTGISASLLLPNNNILVSSSQGFSEITPSGTVLWTKAGIQLIRMQFYGGNKILGIKYGSGSLCRFTQSYDFTDSIIGNPYGLEFIQQNDTIYSITNDSQGALYKVMDTSFVTISTGTASTAQVTHAAIRKNGTGTAILSNYGLSLQYSIFSGYHYATALNVFDGFSYTQFSKNIAVISVEQDSVNLINNVVSLRAKVKVKNNGTLPVASFKLNAFRYPRIDCGGYYYQENFSANLAPGDSVSVITSFISRVEYTSTTTSRFCIYSTLPDGEADKYLGDNEICTDVDLTVLGIKSSWAEEAPAVFPNPFTNVIQVKFGEDNFQVKIMDMTGKIIYEEKISNSDKEIDMSQLNAGLYVIQVTGKSSVYIRKVVKE
jgi:hypothetical protein